MKKNILQAINFFFSLHRVQNQHIQHSKFSELQRHILLYQLQIFDVDALSGTMMTIGKIKAECKTQRRKEEGTTTGME